MPDDLLSIGELARAGGPPVSALRYYDAVGVLRPAHVDPTTGYRWYTPGQVHTARVVASLRQAGLPVADLLAVLAAPDEAPALLARHRRRLEEDLAAAGIHLDAAADALAAPGCGTVVGADLAAALRSVRHAVGADPTWPGLAGVLLHLDGGTLRLVASDRFRLAVASVPVREPAGPPTRVVAPLAYLDAVTSAASPGVGTIALGPHLLDVLGVPGDPLDAAFPDYEALLPTTGAPQATVPTDRFAERVSRAEEVVVLRLDHGRVDVAAPERRHTHAFSRTFLLDAVRAARSDSLGLTAEGDGSALRVVAGDRPDDFGLVMPIRLHH